MRSHGLKRTRTAGRSEAGWLSREAGSRDSEAGSHLSLAGPGRQLHALGRFVNYHRVFMGRSLGVFVGTEP